MIRPVNQGEMKDQSTAKGLLAFWTRVSESHQFEMCMIATERPLIAKHSKFPRLWRVRSGTPAMQPYCLVNANERTLVFWL